MKTCIQFVFLYFFQFLSYYTQAKSFDIPLQVDWIRQVNTLLPGQSNLVYNSFQMNAMPGDTLLLIGGTRNPIRIDDLLGDSLHPIVICNKNSQVIITPTSGGYFGLAFTACRYVKVSGKNYPALPFGIHLTNLPSGSALSINNFSSNFEVEGVEISRIYSSGIVAKTDPNCANLGVYTNFVMYDLKFHHNYIHHTGNEGFYIGNTSYGEGSGTRLNCTSPLFSGGVLPHKIVGVKVYENILDSNGWDAIQVASATEVEIFDNYITNDSYADVMNQQSGIFIGQPCQAKVYRNIIKDGKGSGIQCFGVGTSIYNNLIVNPGNSTQARGVYNTSGQLVNATFTYGIYVNDKVCKDITVPRLPYLVAHNTVIIPKVYRVGAPYNSWAPQGINANSFAYITGSYFVNNLVVIDSNMVIVNGSPIAGIYASNSVPGYSLVNAPAFISCNSRSTLGNNFYASEIQSVNFNNINTGDYSLQVSSAAKDAAVGSAISTFSILNRDMQQVIRPQGSSPDFGTYEHQLIQNNTGYSGMIISPNPISLSQIFGLSFTCLLYDSSALPNSQIELTGLYGSQSMTILTEQVVNGKRVLTFSGSQLPAQTGVYSLQVRSNGVLKAFANLLLIP